MTAKAPAVWADRGFRVMEGDYIIKSVMTRLLPIGIFLQLLHQKKLDRLVRLADKYITA